MQDSSPVHSQLAVLT